MNKSSQWIVGVDLRKRSDGALRFATWLQSQYKDTPTLHGVHVLVSAQLKSLRKFGSKADIISRLQAEAKLVADNAGVGDALRSLEVQEHRNVVIGMTSACEEHHASVLVVGRKSGATEGGVVRLGSVARKLLRRLVAPTIVVPPDLETSSFTSGPVVLAAVPGDSSVGALRFAQNMAAQLGRPLIIVHVVRTPIEYAHLYSSSGELQRIRQEHSDYAFRALKTWLAENDASDHKVDIRLGLEFDALSAACHEHNAALLICGTRRLSGFERIALLSVSSDLAAHASFPVAVVPPDDA
jgi:nucleotide-binding universal stress UspA family protein